MPLSRPPAIPMATAFASASPNSSRLIFCAQWTVPVKLESSISSKSARDVARPEGGSLFRIRLPAEPESFTAGS